MKKWYVDAARVAVNWSTAVVGGVATEDIFVLHQQAGDRGPSMSLFAHHGAPVPATVLAAAQAAASTDPIPAPYVPPAPPADPGSTPEIDPVAGPAITTETSRAQAAEAAEATARGAADTAETSRAQGAEATEATARGAETTRATAAEAAKQNVVVHGATASTARPASATVVHWVGSVVPTNASANDEWTDTANSALWRFDGTVWVPIVGNPITLDFMQVAGGVDQATATTSLVTVTGAGGTGTLQVVATAAKLALYPTVKVRFQASATVQGAAGRITVALLDNGVVVDAKAVYVGATNTQQAISLTWGGLTPTQGIAHTYTFQVQPSGTSTTGVTVIKQATNYVQAELMRG